MQYSNHAVRQRAALFFSVERRDGFPAAQSRQEEDVLIPSAPRKHALARHLSVVGLMAIFLSVIPVSRAETYVLDHANPLMDIWEYPFATSGTRMTASTFGSVGEVDFDNRDGQFFISFGTGTVPTGLSSSNYLIQSARLTLTLSVGKVVFDGTYDSITTYQSDGAPLQDDPGRPMELYGAGYRNGVTSSTITESTPFNPGGATGPGARSVYPTDFFFGGALDGALGGRDISSNVLQGFDPTPFAIGQVAPGDIGSDGTLEAFTEVTFTLDLSNPSLVRYLQLSLQQGRIGFVASSLFKAVNGGGDGGYPSFYTKEFSAFDAPHLDLTVAVVPEPASGSLWLCALGALGLGYRGSGSHRRIRL